MKVVLDPQAADELASQITSEELQVIRIWHAAQDRGGE
jgi:hypothetical protein